MAPPRRPGNRGLERNLHTHPLGGFRYRKPDRSYVYVGKDRDRANTAARAANLLFTRKSSLVDKIMSSRASEPMAGFVDWFITQRLADQEVSPVTRANRGYELKRIAAHFGEKDLTEVTTRDLAEYLEGRESDWVRAQSRARFVELFNVAIQRGLRTDNPALPLERVKAKRGRARLDYQGFRAIWAAAPAWLQNAMDLQLHTLQRPEDLVSMQWSQDTGSALRLVVGKTGVRLSIQTHAPLRAVLTRCKDNIVSPYILHRLPEKLRPREMRSGKRQHHTQILREQLTRAFAVARDHSGYYANVANPPTFYEIKSLGGSLYRKQGWSTQQVQALMGHKRQQMTEHYLAGHELPFDEVNAGLDLPAMRY